MGEVTGGKAAVALSGRIVGDALRRHGGAVGTLPNERQMTEMYGVGRETVRQALRLLELQGVVDVRPGKNGGATLIRPAASTLAVPLTVLMQVRGTPYRAVVEARLVIEPIAARLAAEHSDGARLDALAAAIDEHRSAEDADAAREADRRFHVAVARSARNPLVECLVDSLLCIGDHDRRAVARPERKADAVRAHETIADAVRAADTSRAESAMRTHLRTAARAALSHGDLLDRPVVWTG